jgi:hypothetical protein
MCEHGRQKSQCNECGGSSMCEHGRQKSRCKQCGGSSLKRKESGGATGSMSVAQPGGGFVTVNKDRRLSQDANPFNQANTNTGAGTGTEGASSGAGAGAGAGASLTTQ